MTISFLGWREICQTACLHVSHTCALVGVLMCWLCVFGASLLSQNHRSVVAFSVRPLEDMNEITSHMLDVVQAHMVLKKSQTVRNGIMAAAEHQSVRSLAPLLIYSFIYIMYLEFFFCMCSSSSPCLEMERMVTWHPCQSRAQATWMWAILEPTAWLIMG